ncbi:hypothetical protein OSB04_030194 [Centaurea solstitialis]|uniref:Uncharacterized protein n=1 Tax=Centaurea solstitialis TaxID=347529 RepID=A0AA38SJD9_9ASTR|nr:hypothetical protein OSB04_030194 [Centaurea solstitialis]
MAGDDRTTPKSTFHPAFGVNNIKNSIPLTLNQTDDRYASWVELFHIHLCAYDVLDHIDPKTPTPTDIDKATWNRLDAIVKQWILATISPDLKASSYGKLPNSKLSSTAGQLLSDSTADRSLAGAMPNLF